MGSAEAASRFHLIPKVDRLNRGGREKAFSGFKVPYTHYIRSTPADEARQRRASAGDTAKYLIVHENLGGGRRI